jgi:hypothetical protein
VLVAVRHSTVQTLEALMSTSEVEQRLTAARERLQRAARALAARHKGGEWEEYWAAHAAVLRLERELAAARGEEHAVPLDFPVQWDRGAPLPHLLRNDYRCLLTFHVREHDPNWDGTYVTVKDPGSGSVESLALEAVNSVHHRYDPARWRPLHHYVLWFHDTTFECVAESFTVELHRESMAELLARACKRLLS